jgi:hypothetical protein
MKEKKIIELLKKRSNNIDSAQIEGLSTGEKRIYESIKSMDSVLGKHNIETTSSAFADKLMLQVMSVRTQTSGGKVLKMLFLAIGLILLTTIIVFVFWSGNIEAPSQVTLIVDQFYNSAKIFSDPKFKQLFLIFEGIVLLVIIEKVISGYRFYHKRSPESA